MPSIASALPLSDRYDADRQIIVMHREHKPGKP